MFKIPISLHCKIVSSHQMSRNSFKIILYFTHCTITQMLDYLNCMAPYLIFRKFVGHYYVFFYSELANIVQSSIKQNIHFGYQICNALSMRYRVYSLKQQNTKIEHEAVVQTSITRTRGSTLRKASGFRAFQFSIKCKAFSVFKLHSF